MRGLRVIVGFLVSMFWTRALRVIVGTLIHLGQRVKDDYSNIAIEVINQVIKS